MERIKVVAVKNVYRDVIRNMSNDGRGNPTECATVIPPERSDFGVHFAPVDGARRLWLTVSRTALLSAPRVMARGGRIRIPRGVRSGIR